MNKFRAVQDTDEYDTIYQCMSCRCTWAARYFGPNYCGFCGIEFEGQLECRPHDVPRWKWDRWGANGILWSFEFKREQQQMKWPKPAPGPVWFIESALEAYVEERGEVAWTLDRRLMGNECTAHNAKQILGWYRKEEEEDRDSNENVWPGRVLYRVRRGSQSERLFHSVAR